MLRKINFSRPLFFTTGIRNSIHAVFIHLGILVLLYSIMYFAGIIDTLPNNSSLMQWDAWWYKSILNDGYSYTPGEQSNIAFFPLFPLIWGLTGFNALQISILNLVLMLSGMLILSKALKMDKFGLMLMLSVPSLFFCYVPYSEGLFFFAGALIIYGMKENKMLAAAGIFLACLTRSVSLLFMPVLLLVLLLKFKPGVSNRNLLKEIFFYILMAVIPLLFVSCLHYYVSGRFMVFFEVQKYWDRFLRIPELYLTTWDGARLVWLDGLAFLSGLLTFVFCIALVIRKIKNPFKRVPSYIAFSAGIICLLAASSLLYAGTDALGGTSIYSLNRFIFASPFFPVLLSLCIWHYSNSERKIYLFVGVSVITWMLFNMHGELHGLNFWQTKIYFVLVFAYSSSYLFMSRSIAGVKIKYLIYMLNTFLQLYLFEQFLRGQWLG